MQCITQHWQYARLHFIFHFWASDGKMIKSGNRNNIQHVVAVYNSLRTKFKCLAVFVDVSASCAVQCEWSWLNRSKNTHKDHWSHRNMIVFKRFDWFLFNTLVMKQWRGYHTLPFFILSPHFDRIKWQTGRRNTTIVCHDATNKTTKIDRKRVKFYFNLIVMATDKFQKQWHTHTNRCVHCCSIALVLFLVWMTAAQNGRMNIVIIKMKCSSKNWSVHGMYSSTLNSARVMWTAEYLMLQRFMNYVLVWASRVDLNAYLDDHNFDSTAMNPTWHIGIEKQDENVLLTHIPIAEDKHRKIMTELIRPKGIVAALIIHVLVCFAAISFSIFAHINIVPAF